MVKVWKNVCVFFLLFFHTFKYLIGHLEYREIKVLTVSIAMANIGQALWKNNAS